MTICSNLFIGVDVSNLRQIEPEDRSPCGRNYYHRLNFSNNCSFLGPFSATQHDFYWNLACFYCCLQWCIDSPLSTANWRHKSNEPKSSSHGVCLFPGLHYFFCEVDYVVILTKLYVRAKVTADVTLAVDIILWIVFAIPLVVVFVLLLLQKAVNIPKTFATPLVPFIPCLGILMNVWFILSLDAEAVYRYLHLLQRINSL